MAVIPPATGIIWHFLECVDELGENRYLWISCGLRLGIISMVWTRRRREFRFADLLNFPSVFLMFHIIEGSSR